MRHDYTVYLPNVTPLVSNVVPTQSIGDLLQQRLHSLVACLKSFLNGYDGSVICSVPVTTLLEFVIRSSQLQATSFRSVPERNRLTSRSTVPQY